MIGADREEYLPWLMCMAVGTGVMINLFCARMVWGCSKLCVQCLSPVEALSTLGWCDRVTLGVEQVWAVLPTLVKGIFRVFSEKIRK